MFPIRSALLFIPSQRHIRMGGYRSSACNHTRIQPPEQCPAVQPALADNWGSPINSIIYHMIWDTGLSQQVKSTPTCLIPKPVRLPNHLQIRVKVHARRNCRRHSVGDHHHCFACCHSKLALEIQQHLSGVFSELLSYFHFLRHHCPRKPGNIVNRSNTTTAVSSRTTASYVP